MSNATSQSSLSATNPIPKRPLGKTGEEVTLLGLGGRYAVQLHEHHDDAVSIVNRAIDLGVNYIDTSAGYGTGGSELNIGTVMRDRRDEVFLATKSHDFTYDGTMALVRQSLRRLQTDHIDLYQHHYLGRRGQLEDLRQAHSARHAFEQLREDGAIRFIGVSGHSSRVLADALEDYPYDCALLTFNAADLEMQDPDHLDRFFRIAQQNEVGVIAMKVVARGSLVETGLDPSDLIRYVLSYPVSTAIIGASQIEHLEENVGIARAFEPMDAAEMAAFRSEALKRGANAPRRR